MKRIVYKWLFVSIFFWVVFSCQPSKTEKEENTKPSSKPNILIILADDMGYSDLGCYGSEINTPSLDRLAENGMRFTKFYNAARCCPSRAALLTGLYPHQAGIGAMTSDYGHPSYRGLIKENTMTIAELLQMNGYNTYQVGKWHVGHERAYWPDKKGFDQHFTFINGASSYYNLWPYRKGSDSLQMAYNGERFRPGENFYMTDDFSDYAIKFIDENKESPFFMYLAYTAPHWPLHAQPEDLAKYKDKYKIGWDSLRLQRYQKMKEIGILTEDIPLSARTPDLPAWNSLNEEEKEVWDTRMALYAGVIDRMDQGIGRIIQKLEEKGELDNTLIIFLSDNGASPERMRNVVYPTDGEPGSERSFPWYGAHWANVSNTPYRFYKAWLQEGGMATPFIAHWPNKIPKGKINQNTMGHIIDLMATCLEIASVDYPQTIAKREIQPTPGKSILPAFLGEDIPGHETLYWEHEGSRAVRQGDWKLVANKNIILADKWEKDYTWQLFNLKSDPSELKNVAEQNPEKVKELLKKYETWENENQVLSPTKLDSLRNTYKASRKK